MLKEYLDGPYSTSEDMGVRMLALSEDPVVKQGELFTVHCLSL
jgi:hypothetical protein